MKNVLLIICDLEGGSFGFSKKIGLD